MWLPDAHLCYLILKAARPCVAVLLHGAATSSAISPQMHQQNPADAPPESRGTIRIRRTPTESCLHLQREKYPDFIPYIDRWAQGCSISSANELEIQQSCSKPFITLMS